MKQRTNLTVLSRSELAQIKISPESVLESVKSALIELDQPGTLCPGKIKVEVPESVSYSMVGRSRSSNSVGFKTSYTHWSKTHQQSARDRSYYTTLTLYDDSSGYPIALLDGAAAGTLRTPAVSALLAQYAGAIPQSALIIGSGTQGQNAAPFLLETFETLNTIYLAGSHSVGLEKGAKIASTAAVKLGRKIKIKIVDDPTTVSSNCDLIIGAAGPETRCTVTASDIPRHATVVVVGYGIAPDICHQASRVITTSIEQMNVTGRDYADTDGRLPNVHAELSDLLRKGRKLPRIDETTFCYNSGLVLTDIAVGQILAKEGLKQGFGAEISLW